MIDAVSAYPSPFSAYDVPEKSLSTSVLSQNWLAFLVGVS